MIPLTQWSSPKRIYWPCYKSFQVSVPNKIWEDLLISGSSRHQFHLFKKKKINTCSKLLFNSFQLALLYLHKLHYPLNLNSSPFKSIWLMLKVKTDIAQWSMDSEKLKVECVSFPTQKEANRSYFAALDYSLDSSFPLESFLDWKPSSYQ